MNLPKFIPINDIEISALQKTRQIFADCYLTSSLNSFCRTENGRNLLKQNISKAIDGEGFNIHFPQVKSKPQDVFITEKEIKNLYLTDRFSNIVHHGYEENNIQKAVELAMDKLINKYPSLKSFICLYANCVEDFEYNFPSVFMKAFTGYKPITINEKTIRMSLKSKKDKVFQLFEEMEKSKGDFNFVAGTGFRFKKGFDDWHCFTVENVDMKNNSVTIYNGRKCESTKIDFKTFIEKFKYLTGYISKNFTEKTNPPL